MRLRAPRAAERRLRQMARQRIQSSAVLRREYRRMRRAHRDWNWLVLLIVLPFLVWAAVIFLSVPIIVARLAMELPNGREIVLGLLSVLACLIAWLLGCLFVQPLRKSRELAILTVLPLADTDLVRRQSHRVAATSLLALLLGEIFFVALAVNMRMPWGDAAACAALGVLHWLVILALAYFLAAALPRWMDATLAVAMLTGLSFIPMVALSVPPAMMPWREFAKACYLLTPPGWVNGALHLGLIERSPMAWWLLAPAGVFVMSAPLAVAWVRRRYVIREVLFHEQATAEVVLEDAAAWESAVRAGPPEERFGRWLSGGAVAEDDAPLDAATARQRVLSGDFLRERDWQAAGPVERAVAARLTPRERMIAEFLSGEAARWSRSLRRMAITAAVVALLVVLLPRGLNVIAVYGGFGLAMQSFVGTWPAAIWKSAAGRRSPAFAHVPLGYREVLRVVMVTAAVRGLFFLPLTAAVGIAFWAGFFGGELTQGLLFGLKLVVVYIALHYMGGTYFASARHDSRGLLRKLLTALYGCALGMAVLLSAGAFLAPLPQTYVASLAAPALFGLCWFIARYDEWSLLTKPIDLVADAAQQTRRQFGG